MQFSNLSFEEFLKYGGLSHEVTTKIKEYVENEWGSTEELEDRIASLEDEVASLDSENYDYFNKIDDLESQIERMQDKIDELEKAE